MKRGAILAACGVAIIAASGWIAYLFIPDVRLFLADPQMRERLIAEKLQRSYATEATNLEQQLRTAALTDKDIVVRLQRLRELPQAYKTKFVEVMQGVAKSFNESLVRHHLPEKDLSDFGKKDNVVNDLVSIRELRVDSVSRKPTSLHTDSQDLLQRYRADVTIAISLRPTTGEDIRLSWPFVASATPQLKWTFPSVEDVKRQLLAALDERYEWGRRQYDEGLNKVKLDFDNLQREQELELDKLELERRRREFRQP